MKPSLSHDDWAAEEFGRTNLFHVTRTKRLVRIASDVAARPAGKVTQVMERSADRQATYGLLDSAAENWPELVEASSRAAFRRVTTDVVLVPTDGTSMTLPGAPEDSDFGPTGTSMNEARGVEVMGAILVDTNGVTLGPAAQHYWTRKAKRKGARVGRKRPLHEREVAYWLRCCEDALRRAEETGCRARLWFQLDRGGDAHDVLSWAAGADCWMTVRAAQDRKVFFEEHAKLWDTVGSRDVAGHYPLEVPGSHGRSARTARMEVRISEVLLSLGPVDGARTPTPVIAVHAREVSRVPGKEAPIEWMLLTTRPGTTLDDAIQCIQAYATRWRIEEAHKTWKSVTKVEESNLRSADRVIFWAAILWSVALRIERMKFRARTEPEAPAVDEFTEHELKAVIALKSRWADFKVPSTITLAMVVEWVAELGGYTGRKNSGGPPGSTTLARGLHRIRDVALALQAHEPGPQKRDQ